jgi:polyketide biosynthesis enoyl-CoA hydratase PksH
VELAVQAFETLRVEVRRGALRVVLDRPEGHNAINETLLAELHAALDLAERTEGLRVVVLEATGPVFCSGMDFADATRDERASDDVAERGAAAFFGLLRRLTTIPRVVVARVDGRVTGGGVGLVAASDFVFASGAATFGLPEALWGLLPCCVLPFLVRRVGFQPAHAMTLSTLPVDAERAARVGLVDELADDAEPAIRRLTARLDKVDEATVGAAKRYLGSLWFAAAETERLAVAEFSRLMSSPVVRDRIAGFAADQRLPWSR